MLNIHPSWEIKSFVIVFEITLAKSLAPMVGQIVCVVILVNGLFQCGKEMSPLLSSAFLRQRLGVADGNCSNFFTIFSFIADGFMIVILAGLQGKSLHRILAAPSRRLLLFLQTFIGTKSGQ